MSAIEADQARVAFRHARMNHWDKVARRPDAVPDWSGAYHRRLASVYQSVVAPRQRVLEVGCGR